MYGVRVSILSFISDISVSYPANLLEFEAIFIIGVEVECSLTNFTFKEKDYIRKDFDLVDFKGLILKVSLIEPDSISRPYDIMPYVIYVHANSSSRVEGINNKKWLLNKIYKFYLL